MSDKKELNQEELEKVTGGIGEHLTTRNLMAIYKDTEDGQTESKDLGRYEIVDIEANGESIVREWCIANNKIYVGYDTANILTDNYEVKMILTTLEKTANYPY